MVKLICPHCGTPAPFTPIYLAEGSVFGYTEGADLAAKAKDVFKAKMPMSIEGDYYAIIECQTCYHCFIAHETYDKDWHAVYPLSPKSVSDVIPEPIKSQFKEAWLCFVVEGYRACVAMCQITLESLWQDKKASGLSDLVQNGIISKNLEERANEIRLWGNLTKHKLLTQSVLDEDAKQLLTYLEVVLNDVYVEPQRLEELKKKRDKIKKSKRAKQDVV